MREDFEVPGFGLAPMKIEGERISEFDYPGYDPAPPRARSWLTRKTERPRRKLARQLERLADRICLDRDEGW